MLGLCQATTPMHAQYIPNSDSIQVCVNNGVGTLGSLCADLRSYADGMIVIQPQNITAEHIRRVRAAVPRATLLGYFNFHQVSLFPRDGSCPFCDGSAHAQCIGGRTCGNGYSCALGAEEGFGAAVRHAHCLLIAWRRAFTHCLLIASSLPPYIAL